jgi:3-hydroxyisobutyrate dehydrogenase/2-hydroxy-3-oxopropionate reductase
MQLGFIGLGAMGLPMARHLVEAGHSVTVASRSRGPIDAAVAFGATEADGPADVAEVSEVVMLCVPNSPEVIEVIDAMLPVLGPGKVVIDCSTISPRWSGRSTSGSAPRVPGTSTPRCRAAPWARRRAR